MADLEMGDCCGAEETRKIPCSSSNDFLLFLFIFNDQREKGDGLVGEEGGSRVELLDRA